MDYLALPLVLKDGYLDKANLHESLTYSVGLILSSRPGIMPFEPEYGCAIWEKEFSDLYTVNKADVRSTLRNAINKYEKRIYNVSVSFLSLDGVSSHALGIAIKVSGNYHDGDREELFEATYHLG